MPIYQPGDLVRLATTFKVGSTLTDPTAVSLAVTSPAGSTTTYTYALAEVTKDATGTYHKDITASTAGIWTWKWIGTGTAASVDEGTFTVERTLVGAPRLCSVDDVRAFLQKPGTDTAQDDMISVLISRASRAIMNFANREFVVEGANPQTRVFDIGAHHRQAYREGIPIDDLQGAPTAVSMLDEYGDTVYTFDVTDDLVYLPLRRAPNIPWQPVERIRVRPTVTTLSPNYVLSVTGDWGFPQIPDDVAQACIVTVGIWMRRDVQAFSATFNVDEGRVERPQGIPSAAQDMVRRYRWIGIA